MIRSAMFVAILAQAALGLHRAAAADCNSNGVLDATEMANCLGLPACSDCNTNGILDDCDLASATSTDCNSNSVPDECELAEYDCNNNGIPDDCDITAGTNNDNNGNGFPDECGPRLRIISDQSCYPPGQPICMTIEVSDLSTPIVGGQFFLEYESTALTFVAMGPGDHNDPGGPIADCAAAEPSAPFSEEIIEIVDPVAGTIDYAFGLPFGDPATAGDSIVATIQFTSAASITCAADALVSFRASVPPTRLTDADNTSIVPVLVDLDPISLMNTDFGCADGDSNGIPDACEVFTDCNTNGLPDEYDLVDNDCNTNGVPDDCELALETVFASTGFSGALPANWTSSGLWHVTDQCSASDPCNPPSWAYFGLDSTCDFSTGAGVEGVLSAAPVLIPETASSPTLSYCSIYNGERGSAAFPPSGFDRAWVSVNGALVDDVGSSSLLGVWMTRTVDLSAFVGQTVVVRWHFDSVDPNVNDTLGWQVDAVKFRGAVDNDCNGNAIPDDCDPDCDGDGTPDDCDVFADCNSNGVPDDCEPEESDCNTNGILDVCEPYTDCNSNSVPDICELNANDCNTNGVPDDCEEDCNTNGLPDECESLGDCNTNDVPDACELPGNDCNANGIPDECDAADRDCNMDGIPDDCQLDMNDCNNNGLPDECEPDCNSTGAADECDIANGDSVDLDGNGVPDECDPDCNMNDVPDFLDIAFGLSDDCNMNQVLDECEPGGGDFDGNGTVDIEDYAAFAECVTGPACDRGTCEPAAYADACCLLADADADGDVDLGDYAVFAARMGGAGINVMSGMPNHPPTDLDGESHLDRNDWNGAQAAHTSAVRR